MYVQKINMSNEEIYRRINEYIKEHRQGGFNFFYNGVWTLQVDISSVGNYRFWVNREDAHGNYLSSLITYYGNNRYATDGVKITKEVERKFLSVAKYLEKSI